MTMPIHINTLEYARKLGAAGMPQSQADAQALALYEALTQTLVVVPDDLALLRMDILARIDVLKVELNARIDALERDVHARFKTVNWMMAASLMMHAAVLYKLFAPHG